MTPMMQQYLEVKNKYKDYILFYRLGDFYEMFFDDANVASKELELTLTGRDCGEENKAPMCGVPYHSAEGYIGKLIGNGHKVAICEQTENPADAKGLVKREVIRVITPGTLIETDLLNETKNNYLCIIYVSKGKTGVVFTDISTAYMSATLMTGSDISDKLLEELSTYMPRELIINVPTDSISKLDLYLKSREGHIISDVAPEYFDDEKIADHAAMHFSLDPKNVDIEVLTAVGAALKYIKLTQMIDVSYIKNLSLYEASQYLEMDASTRRNLELTESMIHKEKRGSLLWVLDKTCTAAGARLLRYNIEHPLTNAAHIYNRQSAVSELFNNMVFREELRELLQPVLDLERLITRVNYKTAGGRELRSIAQTISVLPQIKSLLETKAESKELMSIGKNLDNLYDVYDLIDKAIVDEPPFQVREGKIINKGYSREVDELRDIMEDSGGWVKKIEEREREETGIRNLKIGYNRVFGYYIDIPRSMAEKAPDNYERKQTLANNERYITKELKEAEATILGASEKVKNLEYELFVKIRDAVGENTDRIRKSASALAKLDFYISLAESAYAGGYICPEVTTGNEIIIREGRHPVVEQFVSDSYFVPNDVTLDTENNRLALITGPNMAGKSTYMRQTALMVLMAQIGSFVPASEAKIGIVDKLFTRVGASDDLASGESTFMLEMKEVSYIIKNSTKKSLIIYDEIGRGTSTYDGMSIAKAVAEYSAGDKLGAKTMFATHYHELTELENEMKGVVNYNIAAKKRGDNITFLRKIVRGPADDSYGIEVAKLAGIPQEIIKRAHDILNELENSDKSISLKTNIKRDEEKDSMQTGMAFVTMQLPDPKSEKILSEIRNLDVNTLTPIEAMNLIYKWKNCK